jgi:hypothetical protein
VVVERLKIDHLAAAIRPDSDDLVDSGFAVPGLEQATDGVPQADGLFMPSG